MTAKIRDLIIKETHRALWYEDGVLGRILEAGRYKYPRKFPFVRRPQVEVVLVDMRERDMTIKGQEILTSDKVAIRVSIVVRFRVIDPRAAVHAVENYEDRIYTDVQLAARRSLASMSLEEILTNRTKLSDDILSDVKELAARYGVEIGRADVKDLIFPGDVEQVMNRVLSSQRLAEAQIIDAKAKAEIDLIRHQSEAEAQRIKSEAQAAETRVLAEAQAEADRVKSLAEVGDLNERSKAASAYTEHPALLRLAELETLLELSRTANVRLYVNFNSDEKPDDEDK